MSFGSNAQNRTILRSMTNKDNLDTTDMDEMNLEGRVEITINAGPACEEAKDFLEQAIADGNANTTAIAQQSCDSICGETCSNANNTDDNATRNFISATLFILMQLVMQHF